MPSLIVLAYSELLTMVSLGLLTDANLMIGVIRFVEASGVQAVA